jgi:hypothetical protein
VGTPEGYYEEVKEGSILPAGQPISARDAHRCWTAAMRTVESFFSRHLGAFREFHTKGQFRELLLPDVR